MGTAPFTICLAKAFFGLIFEKHLGMSEEINDKMKVFRRNQIKLIESRVREQVLKMDYPHHCSELNLRTDLISIRCFVSNQFSTRNRRQLLLTLFRAVKPHLKLIDRSFIHHFHHPFPDLFNKDKFTELSTRQGIHIDSDQAALGYFIRGIRTKMGMSQRLFASKLEISPDHLSLIERGRRSPGRKLLQKIGSYC